MFAPRLVEDADDPLPNRSRAYLLGFGVFGGRDGTNHRRRICITLTGVCIVSRATRWQGPAEKAFEAAAVGTAMSGVRFEVSWRYRSPADTTFAATGAMAMRGTKTAKELPQYACPDLLATVLRDVPERGQMSVGELCGDRPTVMMLPMEFLNMFWHGESYFLTTLQVLQEMFAHTTSTDEEYV